MCCVATSQSFPRMSLVLQLFQRTARSREFTSSEILSTPVLSTQMYRHSVAHRRSSVEVSQLARAPRNRQFLGETPSGPLRVAAAAPRPVCVDPVIQQGVAELVDVSVGHIPQVGNQCRAASEEIAQWHAFHTAQSSHRTESATPTALAACVLVWHICRRP